MNWIVERISAKGLRVVHFTHFSVKRISNAYQDSAVLIENNSQVSIAEIFSFYNSMIDASAAIQNLGSVNSSFMVLFSIMTGHTGNVMVNGLHPLTTHSFSAVNPALPVPTGDSSIDEGNFHVSWRNEASIFSQGLLSTNGNSNLLFLSFGTLNLVANETYSIDPRISPQVRIPCPGCGGGGGGTPPGSSTIDSISTNVIVPGSSISVVANANSVGSGGVTLYLDAYNETSGQWDSNIASSYVGSSTGKTTITWNDGQGGTSKYDWSKIMVYAQSIYGSGPASSPWDVYAYTHSTAGVEMLFTSGGTTVGEIISTVNMAAPYDLSGHNEDDTAIASIFVPDTSSYTVHAINQSISWTAGSTSVDPGYQVYPGSAIASYYQNYVNSNATNTATVLSALGLALSLGIAAASDIASLGIGTLIGVLAIIAATEGNGITLSYNTGLHDSFYYASTASVTPPNYYLCGRVGAPYCSNQYSTLGTYYDYDLEFKPSYIFDLSFSPWYSNTAAAGAGLDPYIGVLHYVTTYEITQGPYYDSLYSTSLTLTYTMGGVPPG